MLEHGGRLRQAAARWGIPTAEWLDLSTGIAPWGYPVPVLSADCWRRLPEDDDGLEAAARACYGASHLLAVPGSQAAIQALPRLRAAGSLAALTPSYGEYTAAWRAAGHVPQSYAAHELMSVAARAAVVVVCNPNNPTAKRFTRDQLMAAATKLKHRDGWLIVDEAFADADGEHSLVAHAGTDAGENIIVLRSMGKFFGMAGARVGFVVAAPELLARLADLIGPWAVAHPSRVAATQALADTHWQARQHRQLHAASARLAALLSAHGLEVTAGCALFQYVATARADELHTALARRGILARRFEAPAALRFGLPGNETEWQRLAAALASQETATIEL